MKSYGQLFPVEDVNIKTASCGSRQCIPQANSLRVEGLWEHQCTHKWNHVSICISSCSCNWYKLLCWEVGLLVDDSMEHNDYHLCPSLFECGPLELMQQVRYACLTFALSLEKRAARRFVPFQFCGCCFVCGGPILQPRILGLV